MKVHLETSDGLVVLELEPGKAPATTENFLDYVRSGFYDGTIFHRVIKDFMIQGGGFEPGMAQKSAGAPIKNEADNGLKNEEGTIAMARTSDPHSASSQFFINAADNDFLNYRSATTEGWGYCVFGRVVEGLDVVQRINAVATTSRAGHQYVPQEDVVIQSAVIGPE